MGTSSTWRFTVVTVALLLDSTFADIMVQPGYGKVGNPAQNSLTMSQSQSARNQPMVQQQQQYSGNQNPSLQVLQQQHALQRQYLHQQHQQQHQQLLGLQHQELQHAATQPAAPGKEVVGTVLGGPTFIPGFGSLNNGHMFSLGPLGLSSITLGGLRGLVPPPLLLATHQQPQMTESSQSKTSLEEHQIRAKRDVRDSGEPKRYRQKPSRSQQDGVANPTVKSKSEASPQNTKSGKSSGDIVGDVHQEGEETVGSPNLLDPLGLMDKAEDMIDDLRSGQLPNPMDMLNNGGGGLLPGFPNLLGSPNPMANSNGNQPMVGQPQQYNKYPMQGQSNNQYMMNQQRSQAQQSSGPMTGNSRNMIPYPIFPHSSVAGPYGQSPYGVYGSPYEVYGSPYGVYAPSYSPYAPFARQSNLMGNQGGPMIGAADQAAQDPAGKMSNGYQQQMTGAANPMAGDKPAQQATEKAVPPGKSMNGGPVVGAPNPTAGGPNPAQQQAFKSAMNYPAAYRMMPGPNQVARGAQPGVRMQTNPMMGSPGPGPINGAIPPNPQMVGAPNPMMNGRMSDEFYDPNLQRSFFDDIGQFVDNGFNGFNDFNGGPQRHHSNFGLDDLFDGGYGDGYNGGYNYGGYDRIYETNYQNGRPYGFGGGNNHHMHHHQSYFI